MSQEEDELYEQIVMFKARYDKLHVIFEELDELIKNGYTGKLAEEAARGLLYAYDEYKKFTNE